MAGQMKTLGPHSVFKSRRQRHDLVLEAEAWYPDWLGAIANQGGDCDVFSVRASSANGAYAMRRTFTHGPVPSRGDGIRHDYLCPGQREAILSALALAYR